MDLIFSLISYIILTMKIKLLQSIKLRGMRGGIKKICFGILDTATINSEHARCVYFQHDFLCHIVNENKTITVYRSTADDEGISTNSILGSKKITKTIFSYTRYLFLFFRLECSAR